MAAAGHDRGAVAVVRVHAAWAVSLLWARVRVSTSAAAGMVDTAPISVSVMGVARRFPVGSATTTVWRLVRSTRVAVAVLPLCR